MSVQNGKRFATKQDLADMYQGILPYLGGMPEVLANKFSKGDLYSTDEKMIGQWIDGKPLYQKTFSFTGLNTVQGDNVLMAIDRTTIDKMVNLQSIFNSTFSIDAGGGGGTDYSVRINASGNLVLYSPVALNGVSVFTTIQYTKTTDSAISIGSDTDYSTDEKIVGTWIDGKPIYQKTFISTLQNTAGETIIDMSSLNIDDIVSFIGIHASSEYWGIIPVVNTVNNVAYSAFPYYIRATGSFRIFNNIQSYFGRDVLFTIQYTKTT